MKLSAHASPLDFIADIHDIKERVCVISNQILHCKRRLEAAGKAKKDFVRANPIILTLAWQGDIQLNGCAGIRHYIVVRSGETAMLAKPSAFDNCKRDRRERAGSALVEWRTANWGAHADASSKAKREAVHKFSFPLRLFYKSGARK